MKIIVVDDSQYTVKAIANMLQMDGHQVTTCLSVEEAISVMGKQSFDVLVTDIIMKDLNKDGTQLAQYAKNKDRKFPVLAITSGLEFEAPGYIDYVNKFVDETLMKGFTKEQLVEAINRVVAKSRATDK